MLLLQRLRHINMEVFVKTLTGKTLTIVLPKGTSSTVDELRALVQDKEGTSREDKQRGVISRVFFVSYFWM